MFRFLLRFFRIASETASFDLVTWGTVVSVELLFKENRKIRKFDFTVRVTLRGRVG